MFSRYFESHFTRFRQRGRIAPARRHARAEGMPCDLLRLPIE